MGIEADEFIRGEVKLFGDLCNLDDDFLNKSSFKVVFV